MALRFLLQPLAPILIPLVLYTLARTESVWVRPVLNDLARILRRVWLVGGAVADSILAVESNLRHYLGQAVIDAEQPVVRWLGAVHTFFAQLIYASTGAAISTARAVEALSTDVLHRLEVPLKVTLRETRTKVRVLDRKTIAAITALVAGAKVLQHTATVTVPGAIAGDLADLRDYVNRRADRLGKQIRRLEKPVAAGLTVGLLWTMLRKAGLGWLRCSRLPRTSKQLCGLDASMFESLLAGTVLIAGTISLVDFAKGMSGIMDEIEPPVRKFWRATT